MYVSQYNAMQSKAKSCANIEAKAAGYTIVNTTSAKYSSVIVVVADGWWWMMIDNFFWLLFVIRGRKEGISILPSKCVWEPKKVCEERWWWLMIPSSFPSVPMMNLNLTNHNPYFRSFCTTWYEYCAFFCVHGRSEPVLKNSFEHSLHILL